MGMAPTSSSVPMLMSTPTLLPSPSALIMSSTMNSFPSQQQPALTTSQTATASMALNSHHGGSVPNVGSAEMSLAAGDRMVSRNINGTFVTTLQPSNDSELQLYRVLQRANLLSYYDTFISQGGDDLQQLCETGQEEFLEIMTLVGMASKPLHVRRFQKTLQEWYRNPRHFQLPLNSPAFPASSPSVTPLLQCSTSADTGMGLFTRTVPATICPSAAGLQNGAVTSAVCRPPATGTMTPGQNEIMQPHLLTQPMNHPGDSSSSSSSSPTTSSGHPFLPSPMALLAAQPQHPATLLGVIGPATAGRAPFLHQYCPIRLPINTSGIADDNVMLPPDLQAAQPTSQQECFNKRTSSHFSFSPQLASPTSSMSSILSQTPPLAAQNGQRSHSVEIMDCQYRDQPQLAQDGALPSGGPPPLVYNGRHSSSPCSFMARDSYSPLSNAGSEGYPNPSSPPQLIPVLMEEQIQKLASAAEAMVKSLPPIDPKVQTGTNKKKICKELEAVISLSEDNLKKMEVIRKYSAIYGRFDCKRKPEKPLTLHEVSVNEAAAQLCRLRPALLTRRDELFPMARKVVRESGYQYSKGHSRSQNASQLPHQTLSSGTVTSSDAYHQGEQEPAQHAGVDSSSAAAALSELMPEASLAEVNNDGGEASSESRGCQSPTTLNDNGHNMDNASESCDHADNHMANADSQEQRQAEIPERHTCDNSLQSERDDEESQTTTDRNSTRKRPRFSNNLQEDQPELPSTNRLSAAGNMGEHSTKRPLELICNDEGQPKNKQMRPPADSSPAPSSSSTAAQHQPPAPCPQPSSSPPKSSTMGQLSSSAIQPARNAGTNNFLLFPHHQALLTSRGPLLSRSFPHHPHHLQSIPPGFEQILQAAASFNIVHQHQQLLQPAPGQLELQHQQLLIERAFLQHMIQNSRSGSSQLGGNDQQQDGTASAVIKEEPRSP